MQLYSTVYDYAADELSVVIKTEIGGGRERGHSPICAYRTNLRL